MKTVKRTISFLLVFLLILSMAPAAYAADVTETDTYVLERPGNPYYNPDETRPNMQYSSPYISDYYQDGEYAGQIQPVLYSLYHTTTGAVIPTYCLDIDVSATPDTIYRRLNLEDSSYSSSSAGLIRAIMLEGFYVNGSDYASDDAHIAAVDACVAKLGKAAGVEDLTLGEAISATQCAIWQAAHGVTLSFSRFVRTSFAKAGSSVQYAAICNREYALPPINSSSSISSEVGAQISDRIRTVYNYLLALEPKSPSTKVVSPASFTKLSDPVFTDNTDGTFDVSVTASVDVEMTGSDALTLTASLSNKTAAKSLHDGKQTVTLTLSGVPAEQYGQDVALTISGKQTASGVFLFDALGGRDKAQTMVAMSSQQLPVFASVVATPNRVLNIYKSTRGNSSRPLEGIIFDIYPAATMDEYMSGDVTLPDPENFTLPKLPEYTLITDADGRASMSLTQFGLPDGVYLVVERAHPAIQAPVDPFYVFLPMTNEAGTGYIYEVTVKPKNEVKGGVKIGKDVISLGNDSASVDANKHHTWIISASVPEDIADGKSYVITDTLDSRLDYLGNLAVTLETKDGETVVSTLVSDTDYTLTVTDVDSLADGTPSDSFKLALTEAGMDKVAGGIGANDSDNYRIRVRYDAQINANGEMAAEIPNQASVKYTNSVNFSFSAESDKPVVYTGGANLLKVDADDNTKVLPGATFDVYRVATPEEVAAGENLVYRDDVAGALTKASFFDNAALKGEKVSSVTSDANGKMAIYGLAYGTYYLVETDAPSGYNLMGEAVPLTIDGTTHLEEKVAVLENRIGAVLPSTGGIGTTVYTLGGITLMGISALLILTKKRRSAA